METKITIQLFIGVNDERNCRHYLETTKSTSRSRFSTKHVYSMIRVENIVMSHIGMGMSIPLVVLLFLLACLAG